MFVKSVLFLLGGLALTGCAVNGDPRDPKVDIIDWIERIPITETREYVTKVLSNIQVYRARLGESQPLRLEEDLARARGSYKVPSSKEDDDPGTATNTEG